MDVIYILMERNADWGYSEGPDEWKLVGWTEDPREAGLFRNSATRDINRKCERVKKAKPVDNL